MRSIQYTVKRSLNDLIITRQIASGTILRSLDFMSLCPVLRFYVLFYVFMILCRADEQGFAITLDHG